MREILFRGKRVDNGEWVYGDLNHCVIVGKTHICKVEENLSTTVHEVIPKTVGQYIGREDVNGQKVFEGDIVELEGDDDVYYIVSWFDEDVQYVLDGEDEMIAFDCVSWDINVVGNIFDNPDMADW